MSRYRRTLKNRYAVLKKRHMEEYQTLPLGYAFDHTQFKEMMEKWGLKPNDTDKILSIYGAGDYIQKKDVHLVKEMNRRHKKERLEAIVADKDGTGFIYEMFLNELINHEYGYTLDAEDTLECLGYSWEDIDKDERLKRGFTMACKRISKNDIQI